MKRSGAVAALTVAGVLVAGGTAAALNARVLDSGLPSPVGSAESFLPSEEPPAPTAPETTPAGVALTPAPVESPEPGESPDPSMAPQSSQSTRTASATRTRTATASRSSSPRPTRTESHSSSTGDSHSGSDDSSSSSPSPSPTGSHTSDD